MSFMPRAVAGHPFATLTHADVQALMLAHGAERVSILHKPQCPPVVFFVHGGQPQAWVLRRPALLANFARDVARELGPIVRSN